MTRSQAKREKLQFSEDFAEQIGAMMHTKLAEHDERASFLLSLNSENRSLPGESGSYQANQYCIMPALLVNPLAI